MPPSDSEVKKDYCWSILSLDVIPEHFDCDDKPSEFMKLLVTNQRKIYAFVLSMVPQKSDSEDILQDTLSEMWKKFDQFEPGTNFASWGMTIAKFKILNYRRKTNKIKLQFSNQLMELICSDSKRRIKTMETRVDALKECTKKLTPKETKMLRLRYEDDLTFRQIASIYGYSHQAIHKAISLIHARLAKCIKECLL